MFPCRQRQAVSLVLRMGGQVSRDVGLRFRINPDLVPTNRRGVEPGGVLVCATRNSSAGADGGTPGEFDVSGANGTATHGIAATVSQGTAAMAAARAPNYSNHQLQQSDLQRRGRRRLVALGPAVDRALCADACAAPRTRRDHLSVINGFFLHGQRARRDQRCLYA